MKLEVGEGQRGGMSEPMQSRLLPAHSSASSSSANGVSTVDLANDLIATMLSGEQPTQHTVSQQHQMQQQHQQQHHNVVMIGLQSPSITSSSHHNHETIGSFC